jgi:hypothetical protein
MSKKRIQLTINQSLLEKAEALAKARYCDSISELVETLLRDEEAKQQQDKPPGDITPNRKNPGGPPGPRGTYPEHKSDAYIMNDADKKKKPGGNK